MHSRYLLAAFATALALSAAAPRGNLPPVTDAQIAQHSSDLASPLPQLRRAAADKLGEIGPRAAQSVDALVLALEDRDGLVRANAAWALGKLNQPSARVIAALARRLEPSEPEWPVRHNASLSLSWLGEAAVPAVQKLLAQDGSATRAYAVDALLRIDAAKFASQCAPIITALLADREDPVRAFSATLAGSLGGGGGPTVPALIKLLSDPNSSARINAVQALAKIGAPARSALPALEKALKGDTEQWVRIQSVIALGELGSESPTTIPALAAALSDSKERVSAYAAQALAKMGESAVPALQAALASEQKVTRMSAADSLAYLGKDAGRNAPAAASSLTTVLEKDADWEVRSRAATALGVLGTSTPSVLAALTARLGDENEIVRLHAQLALEKLGHPVDSATGKPKPRAAATSASRAAAAAS